MGRKVQRGDPIYTLRMPDAIAEGLRQMAKDNGTSMSAILRDLAAAELKRRGYRLEEKPLEGQVKI